MGKCITPLSPGAKRWYDGRKNQKVKRQTSKSIWVHCASLGEYLQVKSLITKIKDQQPNRSIVLTFFSPSGFTHFTDYDLVADCYYLPLDVPSKMKPLIDRINPSLVIFAKNEVWFNLIHILKKRDLPFVFVASTFKKTSKILSLCTFPFFASMKDAQAFYVQGNDHARDMAKYDFQGVEVVGDPRTDTVVERKRMSFTDSKILTFLDNANSVCICGSTHLADEKIIIPVLEKSHFDKIIIAPHDVNPARVSEIKLSINDNITLYSDAEIQQDRWMILDTVGLLADIYRYASVVYIGGGFGNGIHNTLEPAIHGKPIIFGPNYTAFDEAVDFVNLQTAFAITDGVSMEKAIHGLQEQEMSQIFHDYFDQKQGATERIFQSLYSNTLLS